MHVYEEDAECRSDSVIECLSWMRCVDTADQRHFLHANQNANQTPQLDPVAAPDPDADPDTNNNHAQAAVAAAFGDDPHESTLRRAYQQASFDYGWLACGNARCIVSITQTQLVSTRTNELCPSSTGEECARPARLGPNANANANGASDTPDAARTNFNLWGHKHKVIHVRWNEPYQKLASCSQNGVIFVWVKHDGRWSVELINDRNQQVSDFRWSYDGRLALITYADGFVLVGNVNGQRHWSTLLPLRTGAASGDTQQSNGGDNAASAAGTPPSPNAANAEPVRLTCGIWTPRNKRVLFGTSAGRLLVVSAQTGHIVADYPVRGTRFAIVQLEWNCAAWHLVDELHSAHSNTARSATADQHASPLLRPAAVEMATSSSSGTDRDSAHDDADGYTLACALSNGDILLLRNADPEETVRTIETRLERVRMAFSRGGSLLAVCGRVAEPSVGSVGTSVERRPTSASASASCDQSEPGDSVLRFYSASGELVRSYTLLRRGARKRSMDDEEDASRRANAVCWAHDDARVFVACGCHVRTFWIRMAMSPLAALTCIAIRRAIGSRRAVTRLPLPGALQRSVDHYFAATIRSRSRLPTARSLREFVCSPPASRLFCTMKRVAGGAHARHGAVEADVGLNGEPKTPGAAADSASLSPDVCYVLYLEFLGGLIPLLKAKRSSRFRLDFVVFDPLADVCSEPVTTDTCQAASRAYCSECQRLRSQQRTATSTSSAPSYSYSLPVGADQRDCLLSRLATSGESSLPSYDESALRENSPLAAVVANLWGTKFRVCGLQPFVPKALGTVQYKPSLFHLQPRKMTVTVAELNVDTLAQQLVRRSARLAERVRSSARHLAVRAGSTSTTNELQPLADNRSALRPTSDSSVSDLLHLDVPATTADTSNLLRAVSDVDEFEQAVACTADVEGVDFARMKMIDLDGGCLMHEAAAARFGAAPDDEDDDEDVAMYIDECITVDVTDVDLRRREQLTQLQLRGNGNTTVSVTPTWLRRQPFGADSGLNRPPVVDSFAERCASPSRCLVAPIAPSETLGSLASTSASPGFLLDANSTSRNAERPPTASNACACAGLRQCAACTGAAVQTATATATANELVRQQSGKERASLLRRLMRRGGSNTASATKWIESTSTPVHGAVSSDTTAPAPASAATTRWLNAPPRSAGATTSRSAPATPSHSATTQIRLTDVNVNASARGAASSSTNCGTSQRRTTGQKQDESVAWRLASLLTPKLVRRRRCHSQQVAANAHLTALCTPRVGTKTRLAKRASLERCVACGRSLPKPSPHRTVTVESDEYRSMNTDGSIDETLHRDESAQSGRKSLCESATSRSRSNKLGRKSKVHDGAQLSVADASEAQRVHVMHNKEPIWNELSQVYQLDFGGRVTQESAKNFQIEFNGEQVLQFGRIGNDSFTLDFQHPFSPIQAFGVALANITQRLK